MIPSTASPRNSTVVERIAGRRRARRLFKQNVVVRSRLLRKCAPETGADLVHEALPGFAQAPVAPRQFEGGWACGTARQTSASR
jgi:hypothetical protein